MCKNQTDQEKWKTLGRVLYYSLFFVTIVSLLLVLFCIYWTFYFFWFALQTSYSQCYAARGFNGEWTAWASMPAVETDRLVNVGQQVSSWAWCGVGIFTAAWIPLARALRGPNAYDLKSTTWKKVLSVLLVILLCWYIWGLRLRYGSAGATCAATYLQVERIRFDMFYGMTLVFVALPVIVLCICKIKQRR